MLPALKILALSGWECIKIVAPEKRSNISVVVFVMTQTTLHDYLYHKVKKDYRVQMARNIVAPRRIGAINFGAEKYASDIVTRLIVAFKCGYKILYLRYRLRLF